MNKSRSKKAVSVDHPLTEAQIQRMADVRAHAEAHQEEIVARGREIMRQHRAATAALRETFELLKHERQAQGVTLQELEDRTGIGRGAISRLENDPAANPTVHTLQRIAAALGKSIVVQLTDYNSAATGRATP